MKKEAEAHASEDTEKKDKIEARNKADNMIYVAEKSLKDAGDKVSADVKKEVEEKVKALKDVLETGSKEDLETKTSDLSNSLQKIGQAMYQGQGQQGPNTPPGQEPPKEEGNGEKKKKDDKKEAVEGEVVS